MMKHSVKKYICLILLIFVSSILSAQSKHEFSISLGGGLSGINAETTNLLDVKTNNKFGMNFGLGYAYNFSESFALLSGLEADMNMVNFKSNDVSGDYVVMDREGHWFRFVYDSRNYQEDLSYTYLKVPLMLRYKHAVGDNWGIYAAAGPKVGINLRSKYDNSIESLNTKGAYALWGQEDDIPEINDLELEGFGSFPNAASNGSVELKPMVSLSAEVGVQLSINNQMGLYIGGYLDHALNNVEKQSRKHFIEYDQKRTFPIHMNSVSHSQFMKVDTNSMLSKIKPFQAGLKVSVYFGL